MYTKLACFAVLALMLVGCAGSPHLGGAEAPYPAPQLGVVVDKDFRVVELDYKSAAGEAGVQIGDVLVDLTWIPTEEAERLDLPESAPPYESAPISLVITNGDVITVLTGIPAPTIPVENVIEREPVSFAERQRILDLVDFGVPLKLKLMRDGKELELAVVPKRPVERQLEEGQTEFPTPIVYPEGYHSF